MHKRLSPHLGVGAILFMVMCFAGPVSANSVSTDTGASITVENYFNALFAGDIDGLKSLLSPGLLQKKSPVLDNPSYGDNLRSRFRNATSRILHTESEGADRVRVDTEISLDSGRLMEASFILVHDAGGNFIIDEEVE